MNFDGLLDALGIDRTIVGGSFIGAVLSLRFMDVAKPFLGRLFLASGGLAAALFGTPLVVAMMELKSHYASSGLSFFLGLYGMSLIDAIYQQIASGALINALKSKIGLSDPKDPK